MLQKEKRCSAPLAAEMEMIAGNARRCHGKGLFQTFAHVSMNRQQSEVRQKDKMVA